MNATAPLDLLVHAPPRSLPLHAWHLAHGARLQPFGGWSMPIHYALGVLGEHRHTRAAAGLFDVSHMGQIVLRSRTGDSLDAARALETLLPVNLVSLPPGRQRYAFLTTDSGGLRDDLMIANLGDFWYLVVNAANTAGDLEYLQTHLAATCAIELQSDRALLALQGPEACAVLSTLLPAVSAMRFMDAGSFSIEGAACWVTRSGYTGEDGFEISVPVTHVDLIAGRLRGHPMVQLVGLGARDSLRLEAGLCLYGNELGADTTPIEAALGWAIQPVRRAGGARAGGFPGADVILSQMTQGTARRRVGLRPEVRPVRAGAALFADTTSSLVLGHVTSGTYAPSANHPIAMGYLPANTPLGTRLFAEVRGQRTPLIVSAMPFVPHRYHR